MIKLLAIAGCMCAGSVQATPQWTGLKKVTSVQVVNTGGIIIYLDSEVNPACTNAGTNSVYVYSQEQGVTTQGLEGFRSTAFTALATDMKVNVLYDPATAKCYGKYIVISK